MLRQEQPEQNPPPTPAFSTPLGTPAAEARVTAEEFARALAALEGRKQEAVRQQDGTVAIGQVVQELEVDASPEDIWAEVQRQRAAAEQAAQPPPATPPPTATAHAQGFAIPPAPPAPTSVDINATLRLSAAHLRDAARAAAPGLKQAAEAATPALKQGMDAVSRHLAASGRQRPMTLPAKIATGFGMTMAFIGLASGLFFGTGHHAVSRPAPWRALASVPDGHDVEADTATVQRITAGADPATVQVRDTDSLPNRWILVRHDKRWYVRGYVLESAEVGAGPLKVYTDDNAGVLHGVEDKEVTLRLDALHIDDTNAGDDWSELDVSGVHPDAYTREDW